MQQKKGFTLIELLVVIAIIGILSAIGLTALSGAQSKARDTKRKADLNALSSSLTLFFNENNDYPSQPTISPVSAADTVTTASQSANAFAIPKSPLTTSSGDYYYITDSGTTATIFALMSKMENGRVAAGTWFVTNSRGFADLVDDSVTISTNSTTGAPTVTCTTTTSGGSASNTGFPCQVQPTM